MGTQWLDEQEREAWLGLIAVVELLPGVLESQLRRDSGLTHFEYFTLAMLSEESGRTLRMTELASRTNATLSRLSHVVNRLERRGLVRRFPAPEDRRATNAQLTDEGWAKVVGAAPGHVGRVREAIFAALSPEQVGQMAQISSRILEQIDPDGAFNPRP